MLQGKTFTFQNNQEGFQKQLFNFLDERITNLSKENTIFAIEAACNLWQNFAEYVTRQGFRVVIINPLSTHKARSLINHSYSKTDAKDSLVIANSSREGYFDFYRIHFDSTKALHNLAITYDKLKRSLSQKKLRLRFLVEQTFPEFSQLIRMNTNTALYLMENCITPQEFLAIKVFETVQDMNRVSRKRKVLMTLKSIQEAARHTTVPLLYEAQIKAAHMARDAWITMIRTLQLQMNQVQRQIIQLAKQKT